jgi:hypothetical protein
VLVANITEEFILGLGIQRAHDASVVVVRHVLQLGQEEVSVREAPTASVLALSRPTKSHRNRRPVCWQCSGTGHLRRECPQRPAKEVVVKRYWRRGCAAGERDNASRQVAMSTPTSPRVTLLLDKKLWLEARNATLEKQIKEVKAKMTELEAALERKMKAIIATPKKEDSKA